MYASEPGTVRFTLQSASPRQIPTSPLFSCDIDSFYAHPIVVSCVDGNIDDLPLKCCNNPFKTKVVIGPGNGCCQLNDSCLDVSETDCSDFGFQPFGTTYGCDHGFACNEQERD